MHHKLIQYFLYVGLLFTSSIFAVESHTLSHHIKKSANHLHPAAKLLPIVRTDASIQQGIEQIINSFGHDINIGVAIRSMQSNTILYQHDADRVFMPASTLKLFTAIAALDYLEPTYYFKTELLTNATDSQNSSLFGDLYLKFSGDPELSNEDLVGLITAIKQQEINNINGDVIIDDTAMDRINWGPGWMWDEQNFCYAAPATAVILNRNCFGFNLTPGQSNELAHLKINQTSAHISIDNQVITRRADNWECPLDLKAGINNNYILTGCLAPGHSPMSLAIAINNPRLAASEIFVGLLRQNGISFTGHVLYKATPSNARLLAQHNSRPLSELVKHMLKKSDNLYADAIFKKLGSVYYNTTGTWANGALAIRNILASKTGINFNKIIVVDGAGLSRYDWVSPNDFSKLLTYAYRDLPAKQELYNALPSSGIDGTLRYRLGGLTIGKIHAKTGTMLSTSGLAGYVQTANNQTLAFAILVNGFVGGKNKQATFHLLEDRICQFLAQSVVSS